MTTPTAATSSETTMPFAASSLRRQRRAADQNAQSAIIAIIVLFLLLFLGAIFIALIANNLRGTQRASNVSAAGRYAEAGINYLDQQLTNSPEGADWRPVPECASANSIAVNAALACTSLSTQDPDYFWLQPYRFDTATKRWVGGYTRINFGSGQLGAGRTGGRALVRITYRPDLTDANGRIVDANGRVVRVAASDRVNGVTAQPINKYIKLESIGRSGQVISNDPTTFGNSEGLGLRVEQVAYKAIGINEYVLQATNKNNKPVTATLGALSPVLDRGVKREIETIIEGPVRFNTNLTFYGVNRFLLNPVRNDALEVAGTISLNQVSDTVRQTALTAADPTRVYINTGIAKDAAGNDTVAGNLLPSNSQDFTTTFPQSLTNNTPTPGLVRDNPRGNETSGITDAEPGNRNLRTVSRTLPPLIDAATGPNGLTRYRQLTRDSAPLAPQFVTANPVNDPANGLGPYAGQYGWGQGLYLANNYHVQTESESMGEGLSQRSDWLNPNSAGGYWVKDSKYEPPAVTIILTPRYMILRRTNEPRTSGRAFAFRQPYTSAPVRAGQRMADQEIIRYTDSTNLTTADPNGKNAPVATIPVGTRTFEGYPATPPGGDHPNSYQGDFVIFAEGNVRVRGVAGGYDPETNAFFERHLTIVSGNGNVYIDGNLLRDNIDPNDTRAGAQEVRGRSSIALLAKNSVVVNTTQFLLPGDVNNYGSEAGGSNQPPFSRVLTPQQQSLDFHLAFGPVDAKNTPPAYVTAPGSNTGSFPAPGGPMLFMRHGPEQGADSRVFLKIGINEAGAPINLPNTAQAINYNYVDFGGYGDPQETTTLLLQAANIDASTNPTPPSLYDHAFNLPLNTIFGVNTGAGTPQQYPYTNPTLLVGQDNIIHVEYQPNHFTSPSTTNYKNTRLGVAPLDIRVEALMYAQEGTFFIIPGPWFNPDPNDTYERFLTGEPNTSVPGRRAGENATAANLPRIDSHWPFYREPMDIRMTFYGAITENLPAEVGDQSAWLEKWGWVPDYFGSTGLTGAPNYPNPANLRPTVHGRHGYLRYTPDSALGQTDTAPATDARGGSGILYQFDDRAIAPYTPVGTTSDYKPVRPNPYFEDQPLPLVPRLPVAPGLLYYGQSTN